jgi:DNA topoisomerase I
MAKRRRAKAKRKTKTKKRRGGGGLTKMSYSVSSDLQAVIGTKKATRPQIVKKLWVYIKKRKCQDSKNRRMIVPDAKLSKVLGSRPLDMLKIAGHLNKHIKK